MPTALCLRGPPKQRPTCPLPHNRHKAAMRYSRWITHEATCPLPHNRPAAQRPCPSRRSDNHGGFSGPKANRCLGQRQSGGSHVGFSGPKADLHLPQPEKRWREKVDEWVSAMGAQDPAPALPKRLVRAGLCVWAHVGRVCVLAAALPPSACCCPHPRPSAPSPPGRPARGPVPRSASVGDRPPIYAGSCLPLPAHAAPFVVLRVQERPGAPPERRTTAVG